MRIKRGMLLIAFAIVGTIAFSSSIDYRGNQSADFIRTLNRNAALDGADIVLYNPAGTAMLEDGIYLDIGNQFILKDYSMTANGTGTEYSSTYPSLLLPNFYGIYKKDNWAVFGGIHVPAGGGTVKYEDGIGYFSILAAMMPSTYGMLAGASLEATVIYYGGTLGGSYAINDMFSLSLSGRVIYGTKDILIKTVTDVTLVDTSSTALGFGGIVGFDIKPMDQLNIGIRYESATALEFENDTTTDLLAMYTDGAKSNKDLPALVALGATYDITEDLMASIGVTYYLIQQSNTDHPYDDYDNGFDISGGVEYKVMDSKLILSLGYLYSVTGANEDTISDLDMSLDSHNVAVGGKYSVNDMIDVTVGYNYSGFIDMDDASGSETFSKVAHTIALGINLSL